jgi:hypothetical protein
MFLEMLIASTSFVVKQLFGAQPQLQWKTALPFRVRGAKSQDRPQFARFRGKAAVFH